VKQQYRII